MAERPKTTNARLHDEFWEAYQHRTNLVESIKEDLRFYAGDQWPSNNVKNEIRITNNAIRPIIKNVSSKLSGTPLYLNYFSTDPNYDCSKLRMFDESALKILDHDAFSYNAYVNGENLGTEIAYVGWNKESETIGGYYVGGIIEEHINPLNFAVANPHLDDVQRQAWVMFWKDVSVAQLRDMVEEEDFSDKEKKDLNALLTYEGGRSLGKSDDTNVSKDIINQALLRVYVRFFRIEGEVFFTEETDCVSLHKFPVPMSTELKASVLKSKIEEWEKAKKDDKSEDEFIKDFKIEYEDTIVNMARERNSLEKHRKMKTKFSLYPFAVFRPIPINNSFFGASRTKGMIPMQKAINHSLSMVNKAQENNAYSKLLVKRDALGKQTITNEPGQILFDESRNPNAWGYKLLESASLPTDVSNYAAFLERTMKENNNCNDASTGNITNQEASGYMLQLAIKEANAPLEQEQKLAWKFQRDLARIRIMFYQHYLSKAYYTYELTDGQLQEEEERRQAILMASANPQYGSDGFGGNLYDPSGNLIPSEELRRRFIKPTTKVQTKTFDGESMWGIDFEVVVDSVQGLADSKIAEQQSFDNLILNGGLSKLTPDQQEFYLELNPAFTPAFKAEVRRYIEQNKRSYIQQLLGEREQMMQAIQQLQSQLQLAGAQNAEMQKQFKQSMTAANRVNALAMKDNENLRRQAQQPQMVYGQNNPVASAGADMGYDGAMTEGEAKSNASRGIAGSSYKNA